MIVKISILLTIILDILILLFIDSLYCERDYNLVYLGFFGQGLVLFSIIFSEKIPKDLQFRHLHKVVLWLFTFPLVVMGSQGTDLTGRTDSCPITSIDFDQYF